VNYATFLKRHERVIIMSTRALFCKLCLLWAHWFAV